MQSTGDTFTFRENTNVFTFGLKFFGPAAWLQSNRTSMLLTAGCQLELDIDIGAVPALAGVSVFYGFRTVLAV